MNKPYKILWSSIPCLLGISLLDMFSTIDLMSGDTVFVIAAIHIAIFSSIILAINGVIYFFLSNRTTLNRWTIFHAIVIVMSFLISILVCICFKDLLIREIASFGQLNNLMFGLIFIIIVNQLILFGYLLYNITVGK